MPPKNSALRDYILPAGFICKRLASTDTGMLFAYCDNAAGSPVVILLKRGPTALVPVIVDL